MKAISLRSCRSELVTGTDQFESTHYKKHGDLSIEYDRDPPTFRSNFDEHKQQDIQNQAPSQRNYNTRGERTEIEVFFNGKCSHVQSDDINCSNQQKRIPGSLVSAELFPDCVSSGESLSKQSTKASQPSPTTPEQFEVPSVRHLKKYKDSRNPLKSRRCFPFNVRSPKTSLLNQSKSPPPSTQRRSQSPPLSASNYAPFAPPSSLEGPIIVLSPLNLASRRSKGSTRRSSTSTTASRSTVTGESSIAPIIPTEPVSSLPIRNATLSSPSSSVSSKTEASGALPPAPKLVRSLYSPASPTPCSSFAEKHSADENKENSWEELLNEDILQQVRCKESAVKGKGELAISNKSRSIELMRLKSILSTVSSRETSSCYSGLKAQVPPPTRDVSRMRKSVESKLESVSNAGKQNNRRFVYETLLEVSETLRDAEERELMQQELTFLLERSQHVNQRNGSEERRLVQGISSPKKKVIKDVRFASKGLTKQRGSNDHVTSSEGIDRDKSRASYCPHAVGVGLEDDGPNRYYDTNFSHNNAIDSCSSSDDFLSEMSVNSRKPQRSLAKIATPSSGPSRGRKTKSGGMRDDWTEFIEDPGFSNLRQRTKFNSVPLLPTNSEETDFTDNSAFASGVSHFTGTSQSIHTGGSQSDLSGDQQQGTSETFTSNRSWWRQFGQELGNINLGNSTDDPGEDREKDNENLGEISSGKATKPLRHEIRAKKRLGSRRRQHVRDTHPPIVSGGKISKSQVRSGPQSSSTQKEEEILSLSSIESNLYNEIMG